MSRAATTPARYSPSGAVRIADKQSTAIVYVFTSPRGAPCAIAYHGRAEKWDWYNSFSNEAAIEAACASLRKDLSARAQQPGDARRIVQWLDTLRPVQMELAL